VPVDEHIEVHGIEIVARGVCESGNVPRRNSRARPFNIATSILLASLVAASARDLLEPSETLTRQRLEHRIPHAQKAVPRDIIVGRDTLLDFRERHRGEVQHGVRGEEVEVRHGLVRARHHTVDLIGFQREDCCVAPDHFAVRHCPMCGLLLEHESETLDRAQTPRDARREERVDEPVRVREQHPPLTGRHREPMLDAGHESDWHDRCPTAEHRADRGIPLEQQRPELIGVSYGAERGEATRREREPGARNAVIESKAVHPAFIDQMVNGRPVIGVWSIWETSRDVPHRTHAGEMAEHERGTCLGPVQPGGYAELPREEPAGPGRVDDERRVQLDRHPISAPREVHPI